MRRRLAVQARLAAHNAGKGAKYTRARLPVSLLAYAEFASKHDAMHAEYIFKQLSASVTSPFPKTGIETDSFTCRMISQSALPE